MTGPRNAQASMEFLLVLAISIVIITLIVLMAQQQMGTLQMQTDVADARNSVLDLSSAAREVYAQGEGSRKMVFIRLPGGYEPNMSGVGNKSIRIRASGTDHVSLENFNVRGYLPATPGGHWVWVTSEGNRVRIGLAMMDFSKNRIYVLMERNSTASTSFTVANSWVRNIDVSTATLWNPAYVAMSGVPASFQLAPEGSIVITLDFQSSPDSGGFYNGEITFDATDDQGTSESVDIPVTVEVIGYGMEAPKDVLGPVVINISQDPTPAVKYAPLAIFATATDVQTGNATIKNCEINADYGFWNVMEPVDGTYDQATETAVYNYTAGFSLGMHSIRVRCTDALNNTGPMAYYFFEVREADVLGPIVTLMNHTSYPTTLSDIWVGGIGSDIYTGNNNVSLCRVKIDSGSWNDAIPTDGAWNSPVENFTYEVGQLPVGYHQVYYQCTDSVGNVGGIFNDSFGVVDVDLMLVLDRSGSMTWTVTNASDSTAVSAASTGWSWVKNLSVTEKNGGLANLSAELRATTAGCLVSYEARVDGTVVGSGNTTATSYTTLASTINISAYEIPYVVSLYLKRNASGCTAYNRYFAVSQQPIKLAAAQSSAKTFIDIAGSATYAGLVSYSTSATTDRQLAVMDSANQLALKNAIDALAASGGTCIECGLVYAADELTSSRGRSTATRVIVLLTDGVGNYGKSGSSCGTECSVAGAVYCRDRNVTVYTIGFGSDVNDVELTNIAMLTNGEYYFAPNAATLTDIFLNIGK